MFGLRVPLVRSLSSTDFDGVRTILSKSVLKEVSPWASCVNNKGEIFKLEVAGKDDQELSNKIEHLNQDCVCTCSDCATDDTGYGTDSDHHKIDEELFQVPNFAQCSSVGSVWSEEALIDENLQHLRDLSEINYRDAEQDFDHFFVNTKSSINETVLEQTDVVDILHDDIEKFFGQVDDFKIKDLTKDLDDLFTSKSGFTVQNNARKKGTHFLLRQTLNNSACEFCHKHRNSTLTHSKMSSERSVVVKLKGSRSFLTEDLQNGSRGVVELCEHVLGIVPGHFGSSSNRRSKRRDRKVKIRGLAPVGVASKYPEIHIGDYLKSVNDQEVTWDNLEAVLQAVLYQKQVKLTLQSVQKQVNKSTDLHRENQSNSSRLVQLVTGSNDLNGQSSITDAISDPFYGVLYLSLEGLKSEDLTDKEDIVYQFPKDGSRLVDIRGLFITLSGAVRDISNTVVESSSVLYNGTAVNVGYHREGENVFILAAPASRYPSFALRTLVKDVVRLIQVLFGSVHDAFTDQARQKQLDCFFTLLHRHHVQYLTVENGVVNKLDNLLHTRQVQALPLPTDIKAVVDKAMTDFEASDFGDMSDSYYGCRRSYCILGSCLFYKDYLMCNHLPNEDLLDFILYLQYHSIFNVSANQSIGQLVLWREVFPTRRCHDAGEEQVFGYSEPVHGRWFWLVIGFKHMVMCVLLETGGCSSLPTGISAPDSFLIDQARSSLLQLDAQGIEGHCETGLCQNCGPPVCGPEGFLHHKGRFDSLTKLTKKSKPPKDTGQGDGGGDNVGKILHTRKDSFGSEGSSESSGSESLFRATRKGRLFPDMVETLPVNERGDDCLPVNSHRKLTVGTENCLFHFLYFDKLEGVFIAPNQKANSSQLTVDVQKNFHRCCLQIQNVFNTARLRKEQRIKEDRHFGIEDSFVKVREEGVVFQSPQSSDKKSPQLTYWVVGRCLTRSLKREAYICFHESVPQTIVELAFKMAFGYLPSS